jgi:hypothetical protein
MLFHLEWKNVDENDVNVHADSITQFLAHRSTTNEKKSSITTVFLYELNSFFELSECIDFDFKVILENFSIKLIFITMNLRIKPDEL